jgi:hypothetical protein
MSQLSIHIKFSTYFTTFEHTLTTYVTTFEHTLTRTNTHFVQLFNLIVFIFISMFVFSITGMALFDHSLENPRANFNTFLRAFLTLFKVFIPPSCPYWFTLRKARKTDHLTKEHSNRSSHLRKTIKTEVATLKKHANQTDHRKKICKPNLPPSKHANQTIHRRTHAKKSTTSKSTTLTTKLNTFKKYPNQTNHLQNICKPNYSPQRNIPTKLTTLKNMPTKITTLKNMQTKITTLKNHANQTSHL